jgi:hypothetical protein
MLNVSNIYNFSPDLVKISNMEWADCLYYMI